MVKGSFLALVIILGVSLVSLIGFTVGATDGTVDGDSGEGGESFLQQLHSIGARFHHDGGGHGHHGGRGEFWPRMGELVEQLDLSEEQTERLDSMHRNLESMHRTFESHGGAADGSMVELHDRLVEQFEQGYVEDDAIRQMIDQHLEQLRTTAYSVTDDLVALINSLDAEQREIVMTHIQGQDSDDGGAAH